MSVFSTKGLDLNDIQFEMLSIKNESDGILLYTFYDEMITEIMHSFLSSEQYSVLNTSEKEFNPTFYHTLNTKEISIPYFSNQQEIVSSLKQCESCQLISATALILPSFSGINSNQDGKVAAIHCLNGTINIKADDRTIPIKSGHLMLINSEIDYQVSTDKELSLVLISSYNL